MYRKNSLDKTRVITLCFTAVLIGFLAIIVAKLLLGSIAFFTNLFWFQRISLQKVELGDYHFSPITIGIPVAGGLLVGLMARFGSKAIRGHGIPEVMENILTKESKIPRRLTFLKPLSAAIAIGSGGPFGAEGPIIATGSALGSWIGRNIYFKESERKVLLAAGAAAGMTAIFGTQCFESSFLCSQEVSVLS